MKQYEVQGVITLTVNVTLAVSAKNEDHAQEKAEAEAANSRSPIANSNAAQTVWNGTKKVLSLKSIALPTLIDSGVSVYIRTAKPQRFLVNVAAESVKVL